MHERSLFPFVGISCILSSVFLLIMVQVGSLGPGHTVVTITIEVDWYNISSMTMMATHTLLRLHAANMSACAREREEVREQRLLIDLFFRLFS